MKALKQLISQKKIDKSAVPDEKTLLHVFSKIIREEFGNLGSEKIIAYKFKNKDIFIKSPSSAWKSEIWLQKKRIIRKTNAILGDGVVKDIKI